MPTVPGASRGPGESPFCMNYSRPQLGGGMGRRGNGGAGTPGIVPLPFLAELQRGDLEIGVSLHPRKTRSVLTFVLSQVWAGTAPGTASSAGRTAPRGWLLPRLCPRRPSPLKGPRASLLGGREPATAWPRAPRRGYRGGRLPCSRQSPCHTFTPQSSFPA